MPPCDCWGRGCATGAGVPSSQTTAADKYRSYGPRPPVCPSCGSSRMLGIGLEAAEGGPGAAEREAEPPVGRFEPVLRGEARSVEKTQHLLSREASRDLGADPFAARELQ